MRQPAHTTTYTQSTTQKARVGRPLTSTCSSTPPSVGAPPPDLDPAAGAVAAAGSSLVLCFNLLRDLRDLLRDLHDLRDARFDTVCQLPCMQTIATCASPIVQVRAGVDATAAQRAQSASLRSYSMIADCAFPWAVGRRMRFLVRRRHVCAGEEKRILRKDAFCVHALTEKRNLAKKLRGARPNPREVSESLTSST